MSQVQRSSDIIEIYSQRALSAGLGGLAALLLGGLLVYYQSMFLVVGYFLLTGGLVALGYAGYQLLEARKVPSVSIKCPFCQAQNKLTEIPENDFSCVTCHRLIPVRDGRVLAVFQVRCGFCNHLNYYSEKSSGLICEECNREIPIATENSEKAEKLYSPYTAVVDTQLYELVLTGQEHKSEELINCLQHMLALNRNQVKAILDEAPTVLLTGIPRKKAELLAAQIGVHHGKAEYHPVKN